MVITVQNIWETLYYNDLKFDVKQKGLSKKEEKVLHEPENGTLIYRNCTPTKNKQWITLQNK